MRRERERGSVTCDYLERERETESSEGREKEIDWEETDNK
jgi:hypothetical protein